MATYASLLELRAELDIEDGTSDAGLELALEAASREIDERCDRSFTLDTSDQTKLYYPSSPTSVEVIDLHAVTSVKTDSAGDRTYATTLATTDYELWPLTGPPYQAIRIWPTSSRSFSTGRRVQVVGKFGFTESGGVPPAIKKACLLLAARLYKRREAPFGVLQNTDLGQYTRLGADDPDVARLLAPYSRKAAWVLV